MHNVFHLKINKKCVLAATVLLLSGGLLMSGGCKKVCDQNVPQYTLTSTQLAWSTPFTVGTIWQFHNPAGKVRTYQVTTSEKTNIGTGGGKISVCAAYYEEYIFSNSVRSDSTKDGLLYRLQLVAPSSGGGSSNFLQWGDASYALSPDGPVAGQLPWHPATLGGHYYPEVMEGQNTMYNPLVLHLFLTKAEGVVAFDDRHGVRWTRL